MPIRSSHRLLIVIGALIGVGILYAGVVEPNVVLLRTVRLDIPGFGSQPVRILQISDVHMHSVGWRESRVVGLARRASPPVARRPPLRAREATGWPGP